ncbi:unnamed protein product, partial [Amoebophrya sp. A25]
MTTGIAGPGTSGQSQSYRATSSSGNYLFSKWLDGWYCSATSRYFLGLERWFLNVDEYKGTDVKAIFDGLSVGERRRIYVDRGLVRPPSSSYYFDSSALQDSGAESKTGTSKHQRKASPDYQHLLELVYTSPRP